MKRIMIFLCRLVTHASHIEDGAVVCLKNICIPANVSDVTQQQPMTSQISKSRIYSLVKTSTKITSPYNIRRALLIQKGAA